MSDDILAALAAPFDPAVISWRIGATNGDKTKGMALAYIDARDVMNRLDAVCGVFGWQTEHIIDGKRTICRLSIKNPETGEWVHRTDGCGDSDVEPEKGSFSDSLKRAAVNFGIGRYLYDVQSPWVTVEPAGKSWRIPETELRRLTNVLPRPNAASNRPHQVPTVTRPAAPPDAPDDPFADDPPQPKLSDAAAEYVATLRKRIDEVRLPSRIDDLVRANAASLARLKEDSADAYADLMAYATARKGELLAAA